MSPAPTKSLSPCPMPCRAHLQGKEKLKPNCRSRRRSLGFFFQVCFYCCPGGSPRSPRRAAGLGSAPGAAPRSPPRCGRGDPGQAPRGPAGAGAAPGAPGAASADWAAQPRAAATAPLRPLPPPGLRRCRDSCRRCRAAAAAAPRRLPARPPARCLLPGPWRARRRRSSPSC